MPSMNGFWRILKHVGRAKSMLIFPDASVSYSWILGHECVCFMALCSARVPLFGRNQLEPGMQSIRHFRAESFQVLDGKHAAMQCFCKSSGRGWLTWPFENLSEAVSQQTYQGSRGVGSWLRGRIFLGLEVHCRSESSLTSFWRRLLVVNKVWTVFYVWSTMNHNFFPSMLLKRVLAGCFTYTRSILVAHPPRQILSNNELVVPLCTYSPLLVRFRKRRSEPKKEPSLCEFLTSQRSPHCLVCHVFFVAFETWSQTIDARC